MSGLIGNWIKETTTTSGTGTMTLAGAVPGFIGFTDLFADGDTVRYCIQDGNNREIGEGVFTASGTLISRVTIIETLVAGTYDNTSPTAITLSGSAIVFSDITADNLPVTKVKTADTAKTNDNTLADDADLSGFNLQRGSIYRIEGFMFADFGFANNEYNHAFQISQTPVSALWQAWSVITGTTQSQDQEAKNNIATAMSHTVVVSAEPMGIKIDGFIETHATLDSVLDYQWAQLNNDANTITLKLGSNISLTKIQ